jgi:cyclohexanone monooxygenase
MPRNTTSSRDAGAVPDVDVIVVGAGFAGLYMLHRLRAVGLSAVVLEAGGGVGGTWYWNRYPGARCDVESALYSYSFSDELQQGWEWSERYAAQPEILSYLEHVAHRFDLLRDIRLNARVTSAEFDEPAGLWRVRTDAGDELAARFCVMATGSLSAGRIPDVEGLSDFAGRWYHTGSWPHAGVDFSGQRVAVIGTGSSGIQAIPVIATQAARLIVMQRTPSFSTPANNRPLTDEDRRRIKADYPALRERARRSSFGIPIDEHPVKSALEASAEEREERYQTAWDSGTLGAVGFAFTDVCSDLEANATAADFVRGKIRAVVTDPATAELLSPRDYPFGAKRACLDSGYYATFNRDTVELVDLRVDPITRITPAGVLTAQQEYAVDAIVFATGFDAITGALLAMDIRGRDGVQLRHRWAAGPRTYLGLATTGFPNLFIVAGPGSPSVLSNVVVSIEQHVDWIAGCLVAMRAAGADLLEPTKSAEDAWMQHVDEVSHAGLFLHADSWYRGANVPGKPRVFMPYAGGVGAYRKRCAAVAADGYAGFVMSARAPRVSR